MEHCGAFPTSWKGASHLIPADQDSLVINWFFFSFLTWFLEASHYIDKGVKSMTKLNVSDYYSLFLEKKKKKKRLIWKCWLEHMFLLTTVQPNLIERQKAPEISRSYKIYENKLCLPRRLVGKQTQQLLPCQKPHNTARRPAKTRWDISNAHFDLRRRTFFWPNISAWNPIALKNELDEWLHFIHAAVHRIACISVGFHPAASGPTSPLGQSCLLNYSAITWEFGPVFWLGFTVILHATIAECLSCHPVLTFGSFFSSHQHICGKYFFHVEDISIQQRLLQPSLCHHGFVVRFWTGSLFCPFC